MLENMGEDGLLPVVEEEEVLKDDCSYKNRDLRVLDRPFTDLAFSNPSPPDAASGVTSSYVP